MRILIAEDSPIISENVAEYLRSCHFDVVQAKNGEEAYDAITRSNFDFLILDRMMPKIDGASLVRLLTSKGINIPFLFLTALGKSVDRIEGLSLGADDYLVKPFDLEELRLRIENILRRSGGKSRSATSASKEIVSGDVRVDLDSHRVFKGDSEALLSPKEYDLLVLFLKNKGVVLSRDRIFEEVWSDHGSDFALESETINVHVAYLRKKLGPSLIRTVKLVWYVIDA